MAELIFPLINFFIFIGILVYVLKKPLKQFLLSRSHEIDKSIQEAMHVYEKARHLQEKAEQKLNHLEEEKRELLAQSENDVKNLQKKSKESLEALIVKMKEEHGQRLDEEMRKAMESLKRKTIQKIIEDTKIYLQKNMNEKNQEGFIEESLEKIHG